MTTPRQQIINRATARIAHGARAIANELTWAKVATPDTLTRDDLIAEVDHAARMHDSAAMTRYVEGLTERAERALHDEIRRRAMGMVLSYLRYDAVDGLMDAAEKLDHLNGVSPSAHPLTDDQIERLRDLAAYAPLTRRPIDATLDALGWTERYDGDDTATELREGRAQMLYDGNGRVRDHLRAAGRTA